MAGQMRLDDVRAALDGLKDKIVLGDEVLRRQHREKRIGHAHCSSHEGFWGLIVIAWLTGAMVLLPLKDSFGALYKGYALSLAVLTFLCVAVGLIVRLHSAACAKCEESSIAAEKRRRDKMAQHYDTVCQAILNDQALLGGQRGVSVYRITQAVLRVQWPNAQEIPVPESDKYYEAVEEIVWDIFGLIVKAVPGFSLYHSMVAGPLSGDRMWHRPSSGLVYGASVAVVA